jgi:hypothetical protein
MKIFRIFLFSGLMMLSVISMNGCGETASGSNSGTENVLQCGSGETRFVNDQLYFGTAKPTGVVTSEEWTEFLRTAVTPRFPQGLSVWQASGQWRNADGSITHEASFVLNLVHPEDEPNESAVRAITSEYKSSFAQESVLRVKSYVCVSF